MRYGVTFTLLGVCWWVLAVHDRGIAWLLVWPGVAFVLVGAAYLGMGARVFGKRADGTMSWPRLLILLPYVCLAWGVWALLSVLSKEAPAHEVAPGVWVGRRPRQREVPAGVEMIVDLTCELWEPRGVRTLCRYVSCPTLDTGVPELEGLLEQVRGVGGPILIHCAQGHGRSALVAAGVLLDRGIATDAEDAVRRISAARVGVRLNGKQMGALRRLATERRNRIVGTARNQLSSDP